MTRKEELEKTIDFDDAVNRIVRLEKEIAELKEESDFYNKERGNYKALYLKEVLKNKKAKELLKQWLQTSKASGCDNINIVTDTEQFLNCEVEK